MRIKDISKLNNRLLEKNKWKTNKQIDNSAYEQFDLAVDYHKEDNLKEAFKLYEKSAEQGLPEAQYNLALMYYRGDGVEKNINEAIKWFKKSAQQRYSTAQNPILYG